MPSPGDAPGLWDFQLRILSGMRGNAPMVEDALRNLGAGHADMIAARERTEHIFLPAGRFENAAALLGTPVTSQTVQLASADVADDASLTKVTYELPLWPGLVFYLVGRPGLPVAHDLGFARSPQAQPALPDKYTDLRAWAWLRSEVFARFGPPIEEGDIWPPYEEYKLQARDVDGCTRPFWAVFSWNLLQHVEWARAQPS